MKINFYPFLLFRDALSSYPTFPFLSRRQEMFLNVALFFHTGKLSQCVDWFFQYWTNTQYSIHWYIQNTDNVVFTHRYCQSEKLLLISGEILDHYFSNTPAGSHCPDYRGYFPLTTGNCPQVPIPCRFIDLPAWVITPWVNKRLLYQLWTGQLNNSLTKGSCSRPEGEITSNRELRSSSSWSWPLLVLRQGHLQAAALLQVSSPAAAPAVQLLVSSNPSSANPVPVGCSISCYAQSVTQKKPLYPF